MPGEGNVRSATTRSHRRLSLPFYPSEIRFSSFPPLPIALFRVSRSGRVGNQIKKINVRERRAKKNNNEKTHSSVLCVCFGIALLRVGISFDQFLFPTKLFTYSRGEAGGSCSSLFITECILMRPDLFSCLAGR